MVSFSTPSTKLLIEKHKKNKAHDIKKMYNYENVMVIMIFFTIFLNTLFFLFLLNTSMKYNLDFTMYCI